MPACKELGEGLEGEETNAAEGWGGGGEGRLWGRSSLLHSRFSLLASRGQRGDKPRGPRLTLVGLQSYHLSKSWLGQPPPRPLLPTPPTSLNHPSDSTVSLSPSPAQYFTPGGSKCWTSTAWELELFKANFLLYSWDAAHPGAPGPRLCG